MMRNIFSNDANMQMSRGTILMQSRIYSFNGGGRGKYLER